MYEDVIRLLLGCTVSSLVPTDGNMRCYAQEIWKLTMSTRTSRCTERRTSASWMARYFLSSCRRTYRVRSMAWLRKRLKISERRRIGAIKLLLIVDRLDLPVSCL